MLVQETHLIEICYRWGSNTLELMLKFRAISE